MARYKGVTVRNERGHKDGRGYRLAWRGNKMELFHAYEIKDEDFHTSSNILNCAAGSKITVDLQIKYIGAPTNIEIIALFRDQSENNWKQYRVGEWISLIFSQSEIDDLPNDILREMITVPSIADEFTIGLQGTNTDTDNYFIVTAKARAWRE